MAGASRAEGLAMVEESRPAEKVVGYLGGIFAFVLLWIAAVGGPQFGCPISGTATGLCAMDWSYQTANAARRVAYALVGFVTLAVGSFIITRRGDAEVKKSPPGRSERGLDVAVVVLGLLGIVMLVAAVAVGFAAPPTQILTFANSQLPSMGDFLTAYYGTERAVTVYLTAGEAVTVTYSVAWYTNGSTTPVWGGGFPASIERPGQPFNMSGPWATWYIVPQTGPYVIWFYAELPLGTGPYTSNASMTVTAYNVGFPPTIQLALASLGGVLFAAAVGVDWTVHPQKRARRATFEVQQEKGPPQS